MPVVRIFCSKVFNLPVTGVYGYIGNGSLLDIILRKCNYCVSRKGNLELFALFTTRCRRSGLDVGQPHIVGRAVRVGFDVVAASLIGQ